MGIDLNKLKENDLRKFSYADTKNVISELEKIRLPSLDGIDAIERVEIYYSFASIIKNKVDNHEFTELNQAGKPEIKALHMTLDLLLSAFKFSLDGNKLRKQMAGIGVQVKGIDKQIETIDKQIETIDKQVKGTESDYNAKKEELEKQVNSVKMDVKDFQKRVDDSEHTMLTHVLTLMGVFTAVITIIMSVVITSSSWLNNADGASTFFALAVPNLVAIFSVMVLVGLVFIYQKSFLPNQDNAKGATWLFGVLIGSVLILTCLLGWAAVSYTQPCKAAQVHYVISPSEYTITENTNYETGEKEAYCVFIFEGVSYEFPYDEKYIHNGNLYFCKDHKTIE